MSFYISNLIIHNRAPFKHLKLSFKDKDIIVLNAINGGGKTTILSYIVDALYEIAKPYFEYEFANKKDDFYRISSTIFNLNPEQASFVYIRFNINGENIDYIDLRNKLTNDEYNEVIDLENKIPYQELDAKINDNLYIKKVSSNVTREKALALFNSHIATYFPSYRFEYPGYLNDIYKTQLDFNIDANFSGYLPNPIEVVNDLPQVAKWMLDVLIDWQIYKQMQEITTPDGKKHQIDLSPENYIWTNLNSIVNQSIKNHCDGTLRLGVGKRDGIGRRISIMLEKNNSESAILYPSILNISAGEAAVITIFGEILRQADRLNCYTNVNGIVMIDEVDKHLHIKLQKEVLPQLFNLFPNVQFIISTHSPFVTMGLSDTLKERSKFLYLSDGEGVELEEQDNPLYEEVYNLMITENDRYKKLYNDIIKSSKKCKLLVEDTYAQIYKIAWLKLKNISCDENDFEECFKKNADFEILSGYTASGVAGLMNTTGTQIYEDMNIIGLFDYDEEGSEKFYNLKEGFVKNNIYGNLESGFYRQKKTSGNTRMYALLLPIPKRLNALISRSNNSNDKIWKGDGKFSNYVEIESLLSMEYLASSCNYEHDNINSFDFYKAKDDKKSTLWKDLLTQPKEVFYDFTPLFKKIHELFELDTF